MMENRTAEPAVILPPTLVLLDEPFYRKADKYSCSLTWWRFGDELAKYAERFGLYVPMSDMDSPQNAGFVAAERLEIHGRFFFRSIEEYYRSVFLKRRELISRSRKLLKDYGLLILRTPSPMSMSMAKLAWEMKIPTIMFVAGNILTQNKYIQGRGIKSQIAKVIAHRLRAMEIDIAKKSKMVAVWGQELIPVYEKYNPNMVVAAAPNLSARYISCREDTCLNSTIRIVRTARILPSKGIEYILEAVAQLRKAGRDIKLDIAGGEDDVNYLNSLIRMSKKLNISEHVKFHGQIEFGPNLFKLYENADIHLISSLGEGLPRCIAEGRAFGLPTIATRVGGIPTVIEDRKSGLLIEPKSSEQIINAVEQIINDPVLRRGIIQEGYKLVRLETLEFQAARLAQLMSKALKGGPLGLAARDLHLS